MTGPADPSGVRARVDLALADFLTRQRAHLSDMDGATGLVADAIDQLVLGGGKRLRPAFAYWGHRAAGGADSD